MKKILALLVPAVALVGGVAAGEMLRPAPRGGDQQAPAVAESGDYAEAEPTGKGAPKGEYAETASAEGEDKTAGKEGGDSDAAGAEGWFTFPNQFFVPMMRNGDLGAVMILTLTLETSGSDLPALKQQEHRLRDALLRELMIHANTGGFDGNFTAESRLAPLRARLLKAAEASTDLPVKAVLIEDIVRQDG
ncbi:hypothetical protein EYF88_07145 [Paracoccus sediminis]|uniref:Flagellar protein FliL n=1 Tax=Paracoccus sediminis TaxID=1214787 RepID=A0A238W4H0_9RHOB|nr:hypothetical protein [Paracoccus sediminis]TBN51556.1 hypothetical protein EYF88_07145 [Paracoccus sediminis]SNR41297.1 hypothetical protein SAMN06265378_103341 [Paracoccus sediminis]